MSLFDDVLTEEFRVLANSNNEYAITISGKSFSLKKQNSCIQLKTCKNKAGYEHVNLTCTSGMKTFYIHRLLCEYFKDGFTPELLVDHIEGNKSNNSLENLRLVNDYENSWNTKNTKTSYVGVKYRPHAKKWVARLTHDYRQIHLGYFDTPVKAAVAYDLAAIKYRGVYAVTNLIHVANRLYGDPI